MALWAAARGTRSQAAAARRPRVTPRTGGHLQAGGGCWLPFRTNPRPARLNHTLPGNTRDPESHGPYPHHCLPTQPVPFRFPLRPPPPLPRPRQAWKRRSVQGPRPQQGSGSGTGSHCQRPRPWQSPEGFLQEKAGTVQGGESPPGGAGCLGPALAGAPGRPHTHASAEGKLEAETTTWPAQLWLRAPGRGRAPGAAGGGLTATRTTDGACPGAPQPGSGS